MQCRLCIVVIAFLKLWYNCTVNPRSGDSDHMIDRLAYASHGTYDDCVRGHCLQTITGSLIVIRSIVWEVWHLHSLACTTNQGWDRAQPMNYRDMEHVIMIYNDSHHPGNVSLINDLKRPLLNLALYSSSKELRHPNLLKDLPPGVLIVCALSCVEICAPLRPLAFFKLGGGVHAT